jgi:CTP:molybdopterin cytidylyltransferase MocA
MAKMNEYATVARLFKQLMNAERIAFPKPGQPLQASKQQGVYIIRGPQGRVLHVGMTPKAQRGLHQRLRNHLAAQSSFINGYYKGNAQRLRKGHSFSYVVVGNGRMRALLEAYATGMLCPNENSVTANPFPQ